METVIATPGQKHEGFAKSKDKPKIQNVSASITKDELIGILKAPLIKIKNSIP